MQTKSLLIVFGIILSVLYAKAEESPLSVPSESLILTDESTSGGSGESELSTDPTETSTISIENDLTDEDETSFDTSTETVDSSSDSNVLKSSDEVNTETTNTEEFQEPADEPSLDADVDFVVEEENDEPVSLPIETAQPEGSETEVLATTSDTVLVEPSNAVRLDYKTKKALIVPYSQRRLEWGKFIGISAGQVDPSEFSSDFLNDTYDSIYGDDSGLLIEIHMNFKRNFEKFSAGVEFNLGNFKKKGDKDLISSELDVSFYKLGAQLAFDNLFEKHSYVVPYITGGVYQILYKEALAGLSNNGTTQVSFYGSGGLMFSIDWLDPLSARDAYFESGVENTFLFLEGTYFMESFAESDPNFAGLNLNAGIKAEF